MRELPRSQGWLASAVELRQHSPTLFEGTDEQKAKGFRDTAMILRRRVELTPALRWVSGCPLLSRLSVVLDIVIRRSLLRPLRVRKRIEMLTVRFFALYDAPMRPHIDSPPPNTGSPS